MNNWRLIALTVVLISGLSAMAAYSEQQDSVNIQMVRKGEKITPQQFVERRIIALTRQLELTADQQVSIKAALEEEQVERAKVSLDSTSGDAMKKKKLQDIREVAFVRIRSVLTQDQKDKMDAQRALAAERRKKMSGK